MAIIHTALALHAQSQPWAFKGCRNRAWPCLGIGASLSAGTSPAWCHATTLNYIHVILLVTSWGLHGNPYKVTAPRGTIWLAGGLCHDPFTAQAPHSLPAHPFASMRWDRGGVVCPTEG